MQNVRTDIMGVSFDDLTLGEAVATGATLARTPGLSYVVTPNPEIVNLARQSQDYQKLLNAADLVLPDGIGVVYAAKLLGTPLKGLGGKPGVAEQAAENLKQTYPGLHICGTHDGYFQDNEAVAAQIKAAGAKVVFVCLGAPKQEWWISRHGAATGAQLMVGLGGALDVYAGTVKRAPEAWQKLGLEWCYRLLHQPSRVGRMAKLPLFLVQAAAQKGRGRT